MTVYLIMLTVTLPQLQVFSDGLRVPDMMVSGYDTAYLQQFFSKLGSSGRQFYLWRQLPLDMLYPALFAATYSVLLAYLSLKTGRKAKIWRKALPLLPLIAGLFDYLENILLIVLLRQYPQVSVIQAATASVFTVCKSAFGALSLLAVSVLLVIWIWKRGTKY